MFFRNAGFYYGVVMSLEGLRRGQTGSAMMAAFIEIEAEGFENMPTHFEHIELMCEIIEQILDLVPPFLDFVVAPFQDYATGCRCFVNTVREATLTQATPADSCATYWTN